MVWLEYNGAPFDIRESDNTLSLRVIESIALVKEHEFREGMPLGNRVLLSVGKK